MNNYYFRRILPFLLTAFGIELLESCITAFYEANNVDWSIWAIAKTAFIFVEQFAVSFSYSILPYLIYLMVLPQSKHGGKFDRIFTVCLFSLFVGANIFEDVSEAFFWEEFSATFNFIAVDYLIYTKEVIGNIYQSYPIIWIVLGVLAVTAACVWLVRKSLIPALSAPVLWKRACWFLGVCAVCVGGFFAVDIKDAEITGNRYNGELAKDGFYSLFSAFLKNELDYRTYYLTAEDNAAAAFLYKELQQPGVEFLETGTGSIKRRVHSDQPEIRPNIVIVVMESMGSEFLNENMKDGQNLTSNLTRFGSQGIFFPKTYATGTRSVRGLEAVSTSIPPLPGNAILRREGNENIQTIGSIGKEKGYDRKWIYGGYGYFDNMNYFFGNNGFDVLDRTTMEDSEITHTTVWGVCDEDLYKRAVREADKSFSAGTPFMQFVFTTSNHRPYTYPEGKIDIPSKTGREGAVKYADYAVGTFIEEAKTKPWFGNTVFVFIADHGAGSAGKKDLNPETHLIPFIIYSPSLIKAERHDEPISQIDAIPTLLGALNWDYTTSSYGKDARKPGYESRYFISNYQNVGYAKGNALVVLKPMRQASFYVNGQPADETPELHKLKDEAVNFYQHASDWRKYLKLKS